MTRRDKTKSQEGSSRVVAVRIKGEETHSFGMLDLWFRFQFSLSRVIQESFSFEPVWGRSPSYRQTMDTNPLSVEMSLQVSCMHLQVLLLMFQSDCKTVFKVGFWMLVIVLLLYSAITCFKELSKNLLVLFCWFVIHFYNAWIINIILKERVYIYWGIYWFLLLFHNTSAYV